MSVNYNEISKTYDNIRSEEDFIIDLFCKEVKITNDTKILDFGCGTGNYANAIQKLTQAKVFGVEPSDGMREKAISKNPNVDFLKGSHESLPFENDYFDFIYMTDVIHHIPDIGVMFSEMMRVLKKDGRICIVTQSHSQIEHRFYTKYFPTTAIVDRERYPDIDEIIMEAQRHSLVHIKTEVVGENKEILVTSDFVELVKKKGYSMFHLIPEEEYCTGLKQLEEDLESGSILCRHSGETLICLKKVSIN